MHCHTQAATAAEKKALQSKHKAEKELKVSRDQLAEVKAAEADLEASLRKANGDVARALKSLRSMTALKVGLARHEWCCDMHICGC